ncbi:MAG: putative glycosyltransferase [Gemmatimonadales bacterium]|nr:putative glycosyltransferase [Gemmatimonadales bacterium]
MCETNSVEYRSSGFTPDDLQGIAELHVSEIPGGFLSSLGPKLLRLIFETMAKHPECVLIAARDRTTARIVGFVAGTTNAGALYRSFVRKEGLRATLIVARQLSSLKTVWRLLETLRYPAHSHRSVLPVPELTDIAVAKDFVGSGIAQELFHKFADVLRRRGCTSFKVGTGETLQRAQRFYERLGARRMARIEIHSGAGSVYFVYDL